MLCPPDPHKHTQLQITQRPTHKILQGRYRTHVLQVLYIYSWKLLRTSIGSSIGESSLYNELTATLSAGHHQEDVENDEE
jgi:hypothetical protein